MDDTHLGVLQKETMITDITQVFVDYIKHKRRFSVVGACEGAIAGLVGITPAAGYVSVWLAAVIGFLTAVVCALMEDVNEWLNIDEGMDVFKLHGIGGMVGAFLTGIFATSSSKFSTSAIILLIVSNFILVSALDGVTSAPGAIDGEGIQVGRQFAEITAISAYSFVVSCILLLIMKYIPGLHLRISDEAEERGLDLDQFFEEEIGDWGLVHELEKSRYSQAIMGHAPANAGSSSEIEPESKGLATEVTTSDKNQ